MQIFGRGCQSVQGIADRIADGFQGLYGMIGMGNGLAQRVFRFLCIRPGVIKLVEDLLQRSLGSIPRQKLFRLFQRSLKMGYTVFGRLCRFLQLLRCKKQIGGGFRPPIACLFSLLGCLREKSGRFSHALNRIRHAGQRRFRLVNHPSQPCGNRVNLFQVVVAPIREGGAEMMYGVLRGFDLCQHRLDGAGNRIGGGFRILRCLTDQPL